METKNNNSNNVVNLLTFDVNTGSIGIDSQLFGLLSQLIISERNDAAERRKNYERKEEKTQVFSLSNKSIKEFVFSKK